MIQDNGGVIADKGRLRKIIRKKIIEILKGKTVAADNVFSNASTSAWEEHLPVIKVYYRTESATIFADAPREYERNLDISVELVASGPEENADLQTPESGVDTLEDILDDMAEQVECALSVDDSLGGVCDDVILTGTDFEFDGAGALPIGTLILTFQVRYTTMAPRSAAKQGVKDDFSINNIDYHTGDAENTIEAKDTVDLT